MRLSENFFMYRFKWAFLTLIFVFDLFREAKKAKNLNLGNSILNLFKNKKVKNSKIKHFGVLGRGRHQGPKRLYIPQNLILKIKIESMFIWWHFLTLAIPTADSFFLRCRMYPELRPENDTFLVYHNDKTLKPCDEFHSADFGSQIILNSKLKQK